ncbi:non-ribosomal peptide synthase/polyketide synthase [Nostoc sp. FACHB-152]|uniref:non-ribosomal peptide synthetase n=1 Tax=unclassified Nostoc TaxID=2593658 RepID=UPI0016858B75|nr:MULTISPECIES: non-ribosomal peptide synthase/polyketide synthase [unclassified Nostoc]MBD2448701.1 non-ribosomal peptide synthase/polyketide synthase [Nostoc sp. FACHB-152]MBD2470729.1 non-ribosomal peptide synthase/polyketide synthase [Nostoc sp. FACHB-145]
MNTINKTNFPLSSGQEAMWFIYQIAPESIAYNIFITVKINSYLNIYIVECVWKKIIQNHPILRTTYTSYEDKPVQQVNQQQKINVEVIDASIWSEDELKEKIYATSDRPFNLEKDSVLRVNLFTRSAQEHVLVLTMHHIAGDMWSYDLLLSEFQTLYAQEIEQANQKQTQVTADSLSKNKTYADFVRWQLEMLSSSRGEKQRQYWQKQLAGELPILNLLPDKPRPPVQTYQGVSHILKLDEQLTKKLKNLAFVSGTSLYQILLTAFYIQLYRYTNQTDILIGSPMRGRPGKEFKEMVGYFSNLTVLRVSLQEDATFHELLAQVSKTVRQAQKHQDYPFSLLAEQIQPQRDPSRHPLCQVSFTWQAQTWCERTDNSLHSQELVLEMEPYLLGQRGAQLDLSLMVREAQGILEPCWQYNTDLFDAATIRRMAGHFVTLLEGIVVNPEAQIWQLPLLTKIEQQQLLVEWNNTQVDYPSDKCIHQLFEEQVEKTPNAVAVVFGNQQLTYYELNCRANGLAHYLYSLGVGAKVLVGLCVERGLLMVIGLLAILKAGGAYVPLDPEYPQERLSFMLEDAQVSVLLTQQHLSDRLPQHQATVLCLDTQWQAIDKSSQDNLNTDVQATNLAYVIYTSGSTGTPKGVMVEHQGLCNLAQAQIQTFGLTSDSRVLQFASFSFDASIWEVVMAFGSGATLYLGTKDSLLPGKPLIERLRDDAITHITLPPSALAVMPQEELPALQTIIVAGEACPAELIKQWSVGRNLFNAYGPTEASVCATIAKCTPEDEKISIGKAIANTQVYILDKNLQPVPVGVPGELHIGGVGLARGYLNRRELTQERFINSPFGTGRLYKTGDLARYLPDGNIEYLGRIDNQVKIRGFRIELAEIEARLSQYEEVQACCVIVREDNPGDKRLVAYVVTHLGQIPTVNQLRSFLSSRLPNYMVPHTFVMLESLPLTPNGKIDRNALPVPDSRGELQVSFVAPRNQIEEILALIWSEVLRVESVGIHDNFFELGGDSILSIQIISRAKLAGLQLTLKQLFAHPTIAQLATVVDTINKIEAEQELVTGTLPLTPIQHWFFEQNLSQPHHFNQAFLLSVPSDLKPELLQQVFKQLLVHHDALRLRFTQSDSTWQQIYSAPNHSVAFSYIDLSAIPETEQQAAIEAQGNLLQARLNLSENLVQIAFFHLGIDKKARLLIVVHHLAIDGVSWRILLEDLQTAYQQLALGKAITFPAKTTSFKDWSFKLTEYAQSQAFKSEAAYWLDESRAAVPSLPVDYIKGANTVAAASTVLLSLSEAETLALLQDVPKAYNTQINDVLLTALVLVLSRWTHSQSVLFNLEGHGRENIVDGVDLSRTIGWFTTIFPVLIELPATDNPADALKSVKEQLRAIPNKGIGYGLLRYLSQDTKIANQLQALPQAQISFNYLGQFAQLLNTNSWMQPASESAGKMHGWQNNRTHLLEINSIITGERLQIEWTYSSNFHQRTTIESLAQEFIETLQKLIAHCSSPENGGYTPTDFPLIKLNQLELDQLLASLGKTNWRNIEDIYPLSPMQQGMLFESLYAPDSGVYFEQCSYALSGNLNVSVFEQAWQQVIARHSVLRTAFVWENEQQPLQVVYRQVNVNLQSYDWRELSAQEQQKKLELLLQSQRQQGFYLSIAPLIYLVLIQLSADTYQFIWSSHHLLLDGWSGRLIFQDLLSFYQAISQGKNLAIKPTTSYSNYIAWLQKQDQDLARQFWRQKLQGFNLPTPLSVDQPSSNRKPLNSRYSKQQIHLTRKTTSAIQTFVRQHQLTLNSLVQATWSLLLCRYSQETDVVFGVTVSGRPPELAGIESMVGLFINTLPVRVQVSGETQVIDLLKNLQAQQVESEQYSYSSLAEIQGLSDVPRGMSLFESIVVFENYPIDEAAQQENYSFSIDNIHAIEQTNYPLTVVVVPGEQLFVKISYETSRFDDDTITRLLGHFQTLIEGIVAHPEERILQLPMLTQPEQQQLLVEWNDTTVDYSLQKCLHQLFEEKVERTPDAVAVVYEDNQLTYEQLNRRANQLAHYLRSLGVEPDVLVGICVERSLDMIVGLLAILKAGGAYVTLDSGYPQDRLSFMIEDAQVSVLLTQQELLNKLPEHSAQLVCIDSDRSTIAQHSNKNPENTTTPDNLAYVIYTSGSTGKPKGVLVNHANVTRLFAATNAWYNFNSQDVWTMFHSYAFDFSVWEIWGALLYGGKLIVVPYLVTRSPELFYKLLCQEKVTVLNQTPSAFRQLIQAEQSITFPPASDLNLRLVIFGGEALELKSLQPWFDRHGDTSPQLVNMYGITETTVHVTYRPLSKADLQSTASVIGRPIPDLQVYVLDEYLQPVPIGVPGEMYVGGAGVAHGYLNRHELTQQRFISHPFEKAEGREQRVAGLPPVVETAERQEAEGNKLYKTGDLGRYLPNGELEYLGRIDNQVKIRGFRIELGEIEALLASHPAVWESVVIVREDEPGHKRLVAYVVPQLEQSPTVAEVRQFLKDKLPEYMIPSAFVLLESLPLTSNGKIDRRALPKPELDSTLLEKYVAPRTPTEEMLAQIWAQVLKVEQVGIHDNFFELGGHSLLATQLVSRIRNIFKVEILLRELFAAATVAQLAQVIGQLKQQDLELSTAPILRRVENADLQLSYAQQRLWFLDQFEPDSPFYNIPIALRLTGKLELTALEQSLQEIIARHEALRTNFITIDGQPIQVIRGIGNSEQEVVSVVDLKHLSANEQEIAVQQIGQLQFSQPFDLAKEALVRAKLVVLSDTENILFVCMHHIVADGWSMGVFISELATLYNAYSIGQSSPLAPLPIQYADFAIWQRQWLVEDVLQSQLSYWEQQLKDAPALLSLPTDRPRPSVQTYNGTHQEFALSGELTNKLAKLSQEQGVTLFMTLLAAFDTLLYRYTGQEDILVGSPIANRDRSEIEGLIGFFVNTLVMRTDLAGNPTFSELLSRVRDMAMSAYSHQHLPFEMLVEALQPERDLSYTPLFQVMFVLQNAPTSGLELTGLNVSSFLIKGTTSRFDLTLIMQNSPTGLVGVWEYNTDLFDASTIDRMTSHFVTLLEGIIANPEQRISQLPLLTAVEQQQLLIDWNDTAVDYPLYKSIHQLFEEQVELTPDAVAVEFGNQQLTYSQLNCRANQLAHYLQSVGVKPDTLVGLCVERSLEMVIGLLGILKAGAAYVPLDPEYPSDRLSFILEDTQVKVLLTQQRLIDRLPPNQAKLVCLDTDAEKISQCSPDNIISGVQPNNLVYIIYTSGSTGQPKGIAMSQLALCNHILWHRDNLKITRAKTLQFASVSFDVSFQEIFTTWCSGGTLFLITEELRRDALALLGFLQEKQIQRMFLPVVGLQQLAEVALGNDIVNTGLREIITSGEQLQITPAISGWLSKLTDITLHNQYGPSESHLATSYTLPDFIDTWPLLPSIGRPISNTQIYILDKYLQPVPVGVLGEVYIAGVLLAQGYFNRPQLTQEKFIPNPFEKAEGREQRVAGVPPVVATAERQEAGGNRLYKTGDLARYLPDGKLESLGRIDNQVKIRGFRIELGEVEAVLGQLSDIQASCAVVREDIPGDKRLVAYIVPQPEQTISISEVRNFLKEKLPEYMVPSAIVILEALPLSANRKLDRRALPAPDLHNQLSDQYVAPRNPIEEIVSVIWAQVLKVERVGIHDNFFELGGHSLLATQLVSRVRTSLTVELPLRSLFAAPTVAELSQHIQQLQQHDLTTSAILPRTRDADLPLSYAQQRLWFLDKLNPNSPFYNLLVALRLDGTLNQTALQQSLQEIINRHEALRTNFITVNGEPVQVIKEQGTVSVPIVDLQHLSITEKEITLQQLAQQQAHQPFNLADESLIRTTLVVLSETEQALFLFIHHIVFDGWSMGVFVQELEALYNAYSQDKMSPLTPLPIQYADFAIWQRQWLQGDVLQSQLNYWEQQLKDAPALLSLPTDRPRPPVQTFAGAYQQFLLSDGLTDRLTKLSQEQGVTLFMTLLAAYNTLLYRYTGQEDILVGTPIANRDRSEIEGLIGFFVNTLVIRSNLAGNPTFSELLTRVREVALGAYSHQNLPFEMLVEALQPERNLSHTPLFQVLFNLQNAPLQELELAGLTVSSLPVESRTTKVDLGLSMENTTQGLLGVWEYNTDLFDASTIARMTGHFVTLLEGIVTNPQERIYQLPLLTTVEQQQLLVDWNHTWVDYPEDKCIHQLFEEQVERTPDAVALVFDNEQLTYHQLNCRANGLAHHLRSLSVKPDTLVGICVERSIDMVVGLLGILKAGGAYLPLDPEYPPERLSFMLEDAQVSLLLTQQRLIDRLPKHQAKLICLDEVWSEIAQHNQDNPNSGVRAFHLANVIYTSGSTGRPKGVMVEHKGLCNLAQAQIQTFGLTKNSHVLQFASFSFDASISEILMALGSGATLYLGTKDSLLPGKPLIERLRDDAITHITLPPSALAVMPQEELPALQTIVVAGEACPTELIKQWSVGRNFFNAYGPTEASVCATIAKCTPEDEKITIGRAIANTQVFILDSNLQPVPIGVPGELHIGGVGLARGYLNRTELTQEKFIPNPFRRSRGAGEQGSREENFFNSERLYKTGDLARYLPDGNIEYLGRIDNQVKIRGFRIELAEIESLLGQHSDVQNCCVIAHEGTPGNKRLVAYVVPQKDVTLTTEELRQFLANKLPGYMVPAAFVILESLPLTPNGKVDRRALPNPDLHQESLDYVMPNTEIESIIADIWQQVLALENVGIYNNFFELGGHSLILVKVNQQLQEKLGLELSIVDMFNYPTIHSLSKYLWTKSQKEETIKENNYRTQTQSEIKAVRKQQLKSRQQHRSQKKGVK